MYVIWATIGMTCRAVATLHATCKMMYNVQRGGDGVANSVLEKTNNITGFASKHPYKPSAHYNNHALIAISF